MIPANIAVLVPVALFILQLLIVIPVLQWRTKAVEKLTEHNTDRIESLSEKVEANNGTKLARIEAELLRIRDRLHGIEGQIVAASWIQRVERDKE